MVVRRRAVAQPELLAVLDPHIGTLVAIAIALQPGEPGVHLLARHAQAQPLIDHETLQVGPRLDSLQPAEEQVRGELLLLPAAHLAQPLALERQQQRVAIEQAAPPLAQRQLGRGRPQPLEESGLGCAGRQTEHGLADMHLQFAASQPGTSQQQQDRRQFQHVHRHLL
ncbi:hypothetical protein D3C78_1511240 [compost metagenome]